MTALLPGFTTAAGGYVLSDHGGSLFTPTAADLSDSGIAVAESVVPGLRDRILGNPTSEVATSSLTLPAPETGDDTADVSTSALAILSHGVAGLADPFTTGPGTTLDASEQELSNDHLVTIETGWNNAARWVDAIARLQRPEDRFSIAAHLEPSDSIEQISQNVTRLDSRDPTVQRSARVVLERLTAAALPPLPAVRALFYDALRHRDADRMSRFRVMLGHHAGRTLDDDLACLAVAPTAEARHEELTALWQRVRRDAGSSFRVAEWMTAVGDAPEARDWLRELPDALQSDVGIQTALADALTATHEWDALRTYLADKDWQVCDFIRLALLTRCSREISGDFTADGAHWQAAVEACHGDAPNLVVLAQAAANWSWVVDAEALFWHIATLGAPNRAPALASLWHYYSVRGDANGLSRVARERYDDHPLDVAARNNFAFLALLCRPGDTAARVIAADDFLQQPDNPNVAATYAFALYLDGRYEDGLRVLAKFRPGGKPTADTALYLALLQRATGQAEAATQSISGIDPQGLLPEERALLEKITAKTS